MRRYWIEASQRDRDSIHFEGDAFHHIFDVCRQEAGNRFEVLWGDGKAYLVEVTSVSKKSAEAQIKEERTIAATPEPYIHLCVSIPRFQTFDLILEKAVELGVHQVHPFFSDFSFVKNEDSVKENRVERWSRIVKGGTQQSGRGDLMKVAQPTDLPGLFAEFNRQDSAQGLFLYEGESKMDIRSWATQQKEKGPLKSLWVFIGSEGGFSAKEVQRFQQLGLQPVTLGSQVLRVETACLAIVSVLKYEWGLMI